MKAKFKPGDAVLRIDGEDDLHFNVHKGSVYTISKVLMHSEWLVLGGRRGFWDPNNFKLVDDTEFGGNV